jgi:hypothetical protein
MVLLSKACKMKPVIWITALLLSLPFLAGAAFTAYDVLGRQDILNNPESKVAVGWLFTGLMFLAMGVRGWKSHRRMIDAANQQSAGRPSEPVR